MGCGRYRLIAQPGQVASPFEEDQERGVCIPLCSQGRARRSFDGKCKNLVVEENMENVLSNQACIKHMYAVSLYCVLRRGSNLSCFSMGKIL